MTDRGLASDEGGGSGGWCYLDDVPVFIEMTDWGLASDEGEGVVDGVI